jgi:hypothetical protein
MCDPVDLMVGPFVSNLRETDSFNSELTSALPYQTLVTFITDPKPIDADQDPTFHIPDPAHKSDGNLLLIRSLP